ncbi:MAG: rod shape-determining protein [Patescibacteria group bacterium]
MDIAIDLGTANILVYAKGRGIIINEPSVVALNKNTGKIIAIGKKAKEMVGRTPASIVATRPLTNGVVADFEITEQMLRYFIEMTNRDNIFGFFKPRVIIGIPSGVTEVEKRAVENAAINAGAQKVFLVEEPMASAIGARLPVNEASGSMIVDIGGGTTEIAIISLGGTVASKSVRIAGDRFTQDIMDFMKEKYNLIVGEQTAERIKIEVGSVFEPDKDLKTYVYGRDLISGLPKEIEFSAKDSSEALFRSIKSIIESIKEVIETAPPELVTDIFKQGIALSGGGVLLRGFGELLTKETGIESKVTDDPLTAVVRGAGIILEELDTLEGVLVKTDYKDAPR